MSATRSTAAASGDTTTATPTVLLWVSEPRVYEKAVADAGLAHRVELHACRPTDVPAPDLLARCDAMLAWRAGPGVLPRATRLRWIQALTAGLEGWIALPDFPAHVTLTGARGTHRMSMPENILGALFHLTKPYAAIVADQKKARWTRRVSEQLAGKTLGILGLGAIGQEVARKAAALEMSVIGMRRRPEPVPYVDRVYGPDEAALVLAASDFVLLLLPLTPATKGYMNAARLRRMKPSAHLLNFGRGDLVVDADLIEAVKTGVIAGAVLDVFTTEPLPTEHPFWATEGIVVLPHIGGMHAQRDEQVAELFVENLARFVDGRPLLHALDRSRGY